MAAVAGRCYTADTRSLATTLVVGFYGDHLDVNCRQQGRMRFHPQVRGLVAATPLPASARYRVAAVRDKSGQR